MMKACRKAIPFNSTNVYFSVIFGMMWLSLPAINTATAKDELRAPTMPAAPSPSSFFAGSNAGPVLDAHCNIEDIEEANDSQLYTILQELIQTSFFRSFAVDLDTTCPLNKEEEDEGAEEFECGAGADHSAGAIGGGGGGGGLDAGFDVGFGFGGEEDIPLCTVKHEDEESENDNLDSTALNSLSHSGFSSKDQQQTFEWKQQTDMVVQPNADLYVAEDCATAPSDSLMTDGLLPDTFWMDMCSNITQGEGTKTVNLPMNPERNTGYNGTHIWEAIYQETNLDSQYEQRVLYRLISGLHTSTTLSIASHYYPPSPRKGRLHWQAHPTLFYEKFQKHPEYLRNLHFSYVVMLRALKKAAPYLLPYEVRTGDIVQDHAAQVLLKRLLDSSILKSCDSVFRAFDESSMFQTQQKHSSKTPATQTTDVVQLQQDFKAVFHNISSILDCVQCQQCKLHGKLVMLGYGTALKILFIKSEHYLNLERNEIVALINSIAKISESLREVRDLTQLYWEHEQLRQQEQQEQHLPQQITNTEATAFSSSSSSSTKSSTSTPSNKMKKIPLDLGSNGSGNNWELVDVAVGLASSLGKKGYVSNEREAELVQLALSQRPELLILAKHYHDDIQKFWNFYQSTQLLIQDEEEHEQEEKHEDPPPDAIVVGSGLAGLAASLNILDRGGKVILLEKEHLLGGNSNKASSGINGYNNITDLTVEIFQNDTIKSAGSAAQLDLIRTLTLNSPKAISFLKERVGVDLSLKAQLGGHSQQRTHRPNNGMAGAEIIYQMQRAVRKYEKTGEVTILVDSKVTELLTKDNDDHTTTVIGVKYQSTTNTDDIDNIQELYSPNIILSTGGFASDRSSGSYLEHYRPELLKFPTTAGSFSTGDGIRLASNLGADTINMDKVQIHPTGWVDPKDPNNPTKMLAAELMRGIGGILINKKGQRFCNELGTRAYVTDKMLSHNPIYNKTRQWDLNTTIPTFYLVLSSSAVVEGKKHIDLYTHKKLLTKVEGLEKLRDFMNLTTKRNKKQPYSITNDDVLLKTLKKYRKSAKKGNDEFGKKVFRGLSEVDNFDSETYYVGMVTPVLHYCMGGITIDTEGSVLNTQGKIIKGLHAAGEVAGGVHGNNRLAGNSLLECTVYGTIVGEKIPIHTSNIDNNNETSNLSASTTNADSSSTSSNKNRECTMEELEQHNTEEDCWVAIHGTVYDLTDFAEEHPAGAESILDLAGTDGTEAFAAIHNEQMLEDFKDDQVGILV